MERQGEAMAQATPQSLDMFAPEDAVRIANSGADAAIEVPAIRLDKVVFDDLVGTWAKDNLKDQPGFAAALADGTLMIRQASEVPEFNYVEKSFAFFKDGNMIGGGGWGGPFNQTLYDQVAATGVQQAFGSVMGQGFYMTWPGHARNRAGGSATAMLTVIYKNPTA